MSVDYMSGYISHWYGMRRLQQAVSTGVLKKVMDSPAAAVESILSPLTGDKVRPRATYEHPYLGKHLDMLV